MAQCQNEERVGKHMPQFCFGTFVLDSDSKVLERNGQIVELRPKLVETLLVLVEAAPKVISKEEVTRRVWVDSHVVESALARNISELRQWLAEAFGEETVIETIAKRGYRFAVPVTVKPAVLEPDPGGGSDPPNPARRDFSKALYAGIGLAFGVALITWLGLTRTDPDRQEATKAKSAEIAKARELARRTYQSGFALFDHWSLDRMLAAETQFRRTVQILPDDWYGHYGLTAALLAKNLLSGSSFLENDEFRRESEVAVLFGPQIAVTHSVRGAALLLLDWNWKAAEKEIEEGVHWNPKNHVPLGYRGSLRVLQGRFTEAIADFDRALALNSNYDEAMLGKSWALYCAGDFPGAAAGIEQALPRTRKKGAAYLLMAYALGAMGQYHNAREAVAKSGVPSYTQFRAEGWIAARAGDASLARERAGQVRHLAARQGIEYADTAAIDLALENREAALAGVEQALALRHWKALFLAVDPLLIPLHTDPRWARFLSRLERPRS